MLPRDLVLQPRGLSLCFITSLRSDMDLGQQSLPCFLVEVLRLLLSFGSCTSDGLLQSNDLFRAHQTVGIDPLSYFFGIIWFNLLNGFKTLMSRKQSRRSSIVNNIDPLLASCRENLKVISFPSFPHNNFNYRNFNISSYIRDTQYFLSPQIQKTS
jgi:hypothetical protein